MPSSLSPTSVSGFLRFRVGFLVVHCARRFLAPHTFSKADESQASATLGSDSGSVSVVDSSATSYPAGTTWSTREPKTDQEPRPAAAIRSCRLCFGSNVHHPCKLRRLATKRFRYHAWSRSRLRSTLVVPWIVTVSVLYGVRDVLFPRSCSLHMNTPVFESKWLDNHTQDRGRLQVHMCRRHGNNYNNRDCIKTDWHL